MKINPINFIQKIGNIIPKTNPKVAFKGGYDTFMANPAEAEFKAKFRGELDSKKDEIYTFLDNLKDEEIEGLRQGAPVEIISQFFNGQPEYKEISGLMHKTSPENAQNIIQNGFSEKKIGVTNFGPAIYFGTNEGSLEIYSGTTLNADFKGNCANGNKLEKCNELKNALTCQIANYMGIDMLQFSPELMMKLQVIDSFANEYIREKIVNDLKIDGAMANSSGEGYFLVFNPKTLSDIKLG